MPQYNYTAKDVKGKTVKGVIAAEDDVDLANKIASLGYFLTQFKVTSGKTEASEDTTAHKIRKLNNKEVIQFTYQCATLLDAGLPLIAGLTDLAEEADSSALKAVVNDVRNRIEGGESFASALSHHSRSFGRLYLSLIESGEATGRLAEAMMDLTALLEWQEEIRAKVREALTYPTLLAVVMVGVVALLVVKVIPQFEPIFAETGAALPLPTQVVLAVSRFVREYWFVLLGVGVFIFAFCKIYGSTPAGRFFFDRLKLKIPIIGDLFLKAAMTRFSRTFAICFKGGINVLSALDIARQTCANVVIEKGLDEVRESVNMGEKLAEALSKDSRIPNFVVRMVSVGESAGTLPQMLFKVSEYYDKEVNKAIKRIAAIAEPAMIVIMGVVVGFIALAIFLPLFKMAEIVG